ncbi:MAG: hypothetical protein ABI690_35960 [Chloroflexota bacterium]
MVQELKNAAKSGDWSKCRTVTLSLFKTIPLDDVLQITINSVESYLPTFQNHYPNENWPYIRLGQIKQDIFSDTMLPMEQVIFPEWDKQYNTPGDNNFISAIGTLWQLLKFKSNSEKAIEMSIDAISQVFMGICVEVWGMSHLELWNKLFEPENKADQFILSTHFRPSNKYKTMSCRLWTELADQISR